MPSVSPLSSKRKILQCASPDSTVSKASNTATATTRPRVIKLLQNEIQYNQICVDSGTPQTPKRKQATVVHTPDIMLCGRATARLPLPNKAEYEHNACSTENTATHRRRTPQIASAPLAARASGATLTEELPGCPVSTGCCPSAGCRTSTIACRKDQQPHQSAPQHSKSNAR
jgi:hypothetical protein